MKRFGVSLRISTAAAPSLADAFHPPPSQPQSSHLPLPRPSPPDSPQPFSSPLPGPTSASLQSTPPLLPTRPPRAFQTGAFSAAAQSLRAPSAPSVPLRPSTFAGHHRWGTSAAAPLPTANEAAPPRRASAETPPSAAAGRSHRTGGGAAAAQSSPFSALPIAFASPPSPSPSSSPPSSAASYASHPLSASVSASLTPALVLGSPSVGLASAALPPSRPASRSQSEAKERRSPALGPVAAEVVPAPSSPLPGPTPASPPAPLLLPSPPSSPYAGLLTQFPSSSRVRVACELADTEGSYVSCLHTLVGTFVDPLTEALTERRPPLTSEQLTVLFSNCRLIRTLNANFHLSVVQRLTAWQTRREEEHTIGDLVAQFAPYFKIYSQYCSTFDASNRLLHQLTTQQSHAPFQAFIARAMGRGGAGQQSLSSLLIQPIQRVPRYKLLLEQLLKFTPPQHPDLALLSTALTSIEFVASHINEAIRKRESMDAVIAIEEKFIASPGFLHASRVFLRQASIIKVGKNASCKADQFFLFNDLLASARSMMGKYLLKKKIAIDSTFMLGEHGPEAPAGPTRHHLLIFYQSSSCLSLYFSDAAEKAAWQHDLERCIQQAANTIQAGEKEKEREREREEREADKSAREEEKDGASHPPHCGLCSTPFSLFNRRQVCRQCGRGVCADCSRSRLVLSAEERRPERVCDSCASSAVQPDSAAAKASVSFSHHSVSSAAFAPSSPSSSHSQSFRRGHHQHSPSASQTVGPSLSEAGEAAPGGGGHSSLSLLPPPAEAAPHSPHPPAGPPPSSHHGPAPAHLRSPPSPSVSALDPPSPLSALSGPFPPVRQWDEATVVRWLCEPEIGFAQFVEAFRRFHVDGSMLVELTEAELRDEIGMKEALHRKRLHRLIGRLAHGPSLPPAAPPQPAPAAAPIPTAVIAAPPHRGGVEGAAAADLIPKGLWKAQYSSPLPPAASNPRLPDDLADDIRRGPAPAVAVGRGWGRDGGAQSSSPSTPPMPRRAAPALPQRARNNAAVGARGAAPAAPSVKCGKCGGACASRLKFCTSCGAFLATAQPPQTAPVAASIAARKSSAGSRPGGADGGPTSAQAEQSTVRGRKTSSNSVERKALANSVAQRAALFQHPN